MYCMRGCLIVLISLFASAESFGQVALPSGITLYAGGNLDFASFSTISGGSVVAGGDVTHTGGVLTVDQIFGAGGFTADGPAFQNSSPAFQNSSGPVVFNGDILELGGIGTVFDGPISSLQGSIDFQDSTSTINGDVLATGSIEFEFVFGTINGNVVASGPVNITATVNGTVNSGVPIDLTPYTLPPLPAGRGLTAGTNDIDLAAFQDITLAPGTYGVLNFNLSNTVTLTAGSYVFENIVSEFNVNELNFDTRAGNIDLYIAANDFVFDGLAQEINGQSFFLNGSPDPILSNNIFIETAGNLTIGTEVFGTFFAPNGDVTLDNFSDITGRVFAGGNVTVNNVDICMTPDLSVLLGDCDLDGAVSFLDIAPFIAVLTSDGYLSQADCDLNCVVDFLDIAPFIAILSGS